MTQRTCSYVCTNSAGNSVMLDLYLLQELNNTVFKTKHKLYRVSRGGGDVPDFGRMFLYVKVHRSSPKHLYPKLNGYGDNGERKVLSSCGSNYCTCFAYCYSYTAHVRPSVSQPSQAHSAFIINRCHSYSEL